MAGGARAPVSLVVPRRWPGWPRGRGGCWGPNGAHPRGAASPADPAKAASPGGPTPAPSRPAAGCTERAGALRGARAAGRQVQTPPAKGAQASPPTAPPQGASNTVCTPLYVLPQLHPLLLAPAREPCCSGRGGSPQLPLPGVVLSSAGGLEGGMEEGSPIRTAGAEAVTACSKTLRAGCLP